MNLSFNPTAEDDVNLVHATHLIQDSTKVASFLKNSGFEILESPKCQTVEIPTATRFL